VIVLPAFIAVVALWWLALQNGFRTPLLVWALSAHSTLAFVLALVVQVPGLVAERWFFFAQARHPQNLYYQVVS
jgi:DMSO reductase anchor subunit